MNCFFPFWVCNFFLFCRPCSGSERGSEGIKNEKKNLIEKTQGTFGKFFFVNQFFFPCTHVPPNNRPSRLDERTGEMHGRRGGATAKIRPDATRWRSSNDQYRTVQHLRPAIVAAAYAVARRHACGRDVTFQACLRVHRPSSGAGLHNDLSLVTTS